MKFREKMMRFMVGRYGVDQLGRALLWVYLGATVAALFWRPLYFVALALLGWMVFRMFSKKIYQRQKENAVYLRLSGKLRSKFSLQKKKFAERKTHRYRTCPHCKATLRLPYKKGKHTVCCPKCRKDFRVRI